MQNSRCVFNTAAALRRVFIAPTEQSQLHRARCTTPSSTLSSRRAFPHLLTTPQRRTFVVARPAGTEPVRSRLPRDDEITSWSVSLVDGDNKLQDPRSTRDILSSINRSTHSLVVVVPGEPGVPPICKIIDKKKEHDAAKARRKQQRVSVAMPTKTIELNWAIEAGDLKHRLKRVSDFLEKGFKVEIVLAAKRKGRQATEEEAEEVLRRIKECVAEAGAKETKEAEGVLLKTMTMFTEGKVVKKN